MLGERREREVSGSCLSVWRHSLTLGATMRQGGLPIHAPLWLTNLHIYAIIRYLLYPANVFVRTSTLFRDPNANPTSTVGRWPGKTVAG